MMQGVHVPPLIVRRECQNSRDDSEGMIGALLRVLMPDAPPASAAQQRILTTLQQPMTWEFIECPLTDVARQGG